jgi:mycoredoxin-dependent peroxiredoxin
VVTAIFVMSALLVAPQAVTAVDIGQQAPDFRLASTSGGPISLSDFRGKKFVLLEFYGSDVSPTCGANLSARKTDYTRFAALGIQNLAVSANTTFSQQTSAQSLGLPYPLLSDFPDRKVIRSYGVLNETTMVAYRSFFLIDPQGVILKKWVIENPTTTVVSSEPLLKDIQAVLGQR